MNDLLTGASNISLGLVEQRLGEAGMAYTKLPLSQDSIILVMKHGGRILGPFTGSTSSSILWMPSWWSSRETWRNAVSEQFWNYGGERLWIAPEIQYCIEDRLNLNGSYNLPSEMDPGNYHLTESKDSFVQLEANMELKALHHTPPTQRISVKRTISPIANPLHALQSRAGLMPGVQFSGYRHSVHMHINSPNSCLSETWSIMQVRQGGLSIVPTYGNPQIGWYYRPKEAHCIDEKQSPMIIRHSANSLFKIGVHSVNLTGRVGYLHSAPETASPYLIIRNYRVSPSADYSEEPFATPGEHGYAFHLYNSGNPEEQFGEVECHGNAIGGASGERSSITELDTWFFEGEAYHLELIAHQLLSYPIGTKAKK